ncbi:MAG TPA: hypothetical protein VGC05_10800, partial [Mycobacterium sp.]
GNTVTLSDVHSGTWYPITTGSDLSAWSINWWAAASPYLYNQGAVYDGSDSTTPNEDLIGAYNPRAHDVVLDWSSLIENTTQGATAASFNGDFGFWHLVGHVS